ERIANDLHDHAGGGFHRDRQRDVREPERPVGGAVDELQALGHENRGGAVGFLRERDVGQVECASEDPKSGRARVDLDVIDGLADGRVVRYADLDADVGGVDRADTART